MCRLRRQPLEHVLQVGPGVEPVQPPRLDQAHHGGGPLARRLSSSLPVPACGGHVRNLFGSSPLATDGGRCPRALRCTGLPLTRASVMKSVAASAEPSPHQPAASRRAETTDRPAPGFTRAAPDSVQAAIDRSPRMVGQRRTLQALFGPAIQLPGDLGTDEVPVQAHQDGGAQAAAPDPPPFLAHDARHGPVQRQVQEANDDAQEWSLPARPGGAGVRPSMAADDAPLPGRLGGVPVVSQRLVAPADAPPSRAASPAVADVPVNLTGLPDPLKAGLESLSGMDLSNVRVHRNSNQPAQLQALAYAQGNDIHLGPGQEQHLPHEAWHVVQQAQGRVQPTLQLQNGQAVNADAGLEREADLMGARANARAVQRPADGGRQDRIPLGLTAPGRWPPQGPVGKSSTAPIQRLERYPQQVLEGTMFTPSYTTTKVGKYVLPKRMLARPLGLPHGINTGPRTTEHSRLWIDVKAQQGGITSLVDGHLLNHKFGGEANGTNMVPISADANSQMSAFDSYVASLLSTTEAGAAVVDLEVAVNYGRSDGQTSEQNAVPTSLDMRVVPQRQTENTWADDPDEGVIVQNVKVNLESESVRGQQAAASSSSLVKKKVRWESYGFAKSGASKPTPTIEGVETPQDQGPKNEDLRKQRYQSFTALPAWINWKNEQSRTGRDQGAQDIVSDTLVDSVWKKSEPSSDDLDMDDDFQDEYEEKSGSSSLEAYQPSADEVAEAEAADQAIDEEQAMSDEDLNRVQMTEEDRSALEEHQEHQMNEMRDEVALRGMESAIRRFNKSEEEIIELLAEYEPSNDGSEAEMAEDSH